MAKLGKIFYTDKVEAMGEFPIYPDGEYIVEIIKSSVVENSKKTGTILKLGYRIVEGDLTGKMISETLNMSNPNQECVDISDRKLKAICDAIGFEGELEDSADLHAIAMKVDLISEVGNDGVTRNKIKKFMQVDEAEPF